MLGGGWGRLKRNVRIKDIYVRMHIYNIHIHIHIGGGGSNRAVKGNVLHANIYMYTYMYIILKRCTAPKAAQQSDEYAASGAWRA